MVFVGSRRALLQSIPKYGPLTPNQATCTNALKNTTGWDVLSTASISSTTETAYIKDRSLKIVTAGTNNYEGATTILIPCGPRTHKITAYAKAPLGATYRMLLTGSAGSTGVILNTGTGDWQEITKEITTTTDTSFRVQFYTFTTIQAITMNIGKLIYS